MKTEISQFIVTRLNFYNKVIRTILLIAINFITIFESKYNKWKKIYIGLLVAISV